MSQSLVSVVIPVYNEQESLPLLFERLLPVMENLGRPYELIFINDGSHDRSLPMLLDCRDRFPDRVVVIDFSGNFGQHMAIMAGFAEAKGEMVLTMDADLQNPPEEIPRIVAAMEEGHDVVGTVRSGRQDPFFRKFLSRIVNRVSNRITGLKLNDYGCMMRGYSRRIISFINQCKETTTFIPALAQKFALNPVEIPIRHSEREHGQSKYSLFRLVRLNFDLMTGFSLIPLQAVTMLGIIVSILSFLFSAFLLVRRLVVGPEVEGVFTLMALSFLLMGITLFSVGLVGEYIGRIYQEVRERPRFVIRGVWGREK